MSQSPVLTVYQAESRLRRPREFLRLAFKDLKYSLPTARRIFVRGLAQQYRHSSLGILWAFIPAIITAIALTIGQKTRLVSAAPGEVPPPFYGVFGLAMAQTFLEGINGLRMVFDKHANLLKRNRVPIEGLIAAAFIDLGFGLCVRLVMVSIAMVVFVVKPDSTFPLALGGLLGLLLAGGGVGLMLAPFSSLKRDVDNIMGYLPWIIFATSPVFVMPRPGTPVATIHRWNPLAYVLNSERVLTYGAHGSKWPALFAAPIGLLVICFGWLSCRFWRPYVVERML